MPIEFLCHQCQTKLRVGDDAAGKQAKCPKCATVLDIPGTSDAPAPAGGAPVVPAAGAGANPYQAPGGYVPAAQMEFTHGPIARGAVEPGQAFSRSWDIFTQQFGPSFGAIVIYFGVTFLAVFAAIAIVGVVAITLGQQGGEEAVVIAVLAGMAVVGIPLMVAMFLLNYNITRFYLKLCRREAPGFGMLFEYDSNCWPFIAATLGFGLLTMAGYIFCIVPGVYLACMFFPWPLLVLDRRMPVGEAFQLSRELTDGNKMNLFIVGLIYMGISFGAGMIPFGIGTILVTPLLMFLFLVAYLMVSGQYTMAAAGPPTRPLPGGAAGGNPFAN